MQVGLSVQHVQKGLESTQLSYKGKSSAASHSNFLIIIIIIIFKIQGP